MPEHKLSWACSGKGIQRRDICTTGWFVAIGHTRAQALQLMVNSYTPRLFLLGRLRSLPAHLLPEGFSEATVAAGSKGASRDAADHCRHPVVTRRVLLRIHVEVIAQFAAGDVSFVPAAVHRVSPVMLLPSAGKHP